MSAFGHDSLWITRRQHLFFLLFLRSPSNVQASDKWWESRAILGIIIELGCIIVSTSRRTCSQRYRLSQQLSSKVQIRIESKNWTCCCPCWAAAIKDIAMRFTATCNKLKHHKNQRQISGNSRNSKEEMASCRQQKLRWVHKLDNASPTWASSLSSSSSSSP